MNDSYVQVEPRRLWRSLAIELKVFFNVFLYDSRARSDLVVSCEGLPTRYPEAAGLFTFHLTFEHSSTHCLFSFDSYHRRTFR